MPNDNHLKRNLIIAVVVVIVLLLGWQIGLWFSHLGKVKLNLVTIPNDSAVTLDAKTIASQGSIYVKPGDHTLKASHQYFTSDVQQINTDQQGNQTVYLLPNPTDPAGLKWLQQHPDVQAQREAVGGILSQRAQAALLKKYPVIQQLPVNNSDYRIDYQSGDDGSVSFQVTLYGIINNANQAKQYVAQLKAHKQAALQFLQKNGVDTAKTTITFTPNV
jgi:hypothetical protein